MSNKPENTNRKPKKYSEPDYKSKVISMKLKAPCESAILHEYMARYQGFLVTMFERLGGLLQLVRGDRRLVEMIHLWQKTNLSIADSQLEELKVRREALELQIDGDIIFPDLIIPKDWNLEFVVTHPVAHEMVRLINRVNNEIKANEALFFAGVMNEEGLERIKNETVSILAGVGDRLAKATKPGKRKSKNDDRDVYSSLELAKYIRNGFRLDFSDIPQIYTSLVEEYEVATSTFKNTKKANLKADSKVESVED